MKGIMKPASVWKLLGLLLLLASCQNSAPACPTITGTPNFLTIPAEQLATPTPAVGQYLVMVGQKEMLVDKVVEGPLCNDTWQGTVYVACGVQVYPWTEEPTFLKDCQLEIDPQAVVYVAYHNNTGYYKGCSCHSGATPEP
jgi:hypothetical protein